MPTQSLAWISACMVAELVRLKALLYLYLQDKSSSTTPARLPNCRQQEAETALLLLIPWVTHLHPLWSQLHCAVQLRRGAHSPKQLTRGSVSSPTLTLWCWLTCVIRASSSVLPTRSAGPPLLPVAGRDSPPTFMTSGPALLATAGGKG